MNKEFRLKKEIKQGIWLNLIEEMNKKIKMKWWAKGTEICETLNQIELLLISASTVTGCEYISAFAFLIAIPVGIAILAVGLKMCSITAGIKK